MAWTTVTLQNGSNVDLYKQERANECGPSCVVTLGRLLGRRFDIAPALTAVAGMDPNRPPGFGAMQHDFQRDWAYIRSLTQVLAGWGIRTAHTVQNPPDRYRLFCEGRNQRRPAILRVDWGGGSGHFVVTIGKNTVLQQNFIEILDPFYGYQKVSLGGFPAYEPSNGGWLNWFAGFLGCGSVAHGTLDREWSVEV